MTFNMIPNQNSDESGANELYLKMRSRFDFSGNRTIGEFMMAKAASEGYGPVKVKKTSRRLRDPQTFPSAPRPFGVCSSDLVRPVPLLHDPFHGRRLDQGIRRVRR